jgi:hypothetical protein
MIRTKWNITLTPEERHELEVLTKTGNRSVKVMKRVAVILTDPGYFRRTETGCRSGHRTPYRGKPSNREKEF